MKVGLFFGSFNPIHVGHLIIAETILTQTDLDKVWFVVSPQNPFKSTKTLAHEFDRYDMVKRAIEGNENLDVTDVEFSMPKPSYTVDTLTVLKEKFPSYEFTVIMGGDNLSHFTKWKNHEAILDYYKVLVYPRPNSPQPATELKNVRVVDAPLIDISATFIRNRLKQNQSIRYLVAKEVEEYILEKGIYNS